MRYVLLAVIVLLSPACSGSTKNKLRQADTEFAERLGNDRREDIVALMGLPAQKEEIGEVEVWVYKTNQVGKVRGVPFSSGGNVYIQADELVLTFDKKTGVLKTYRANVNKVK